MSNLIKRLSNRYVTAFAMAILVFLLGKLFVNGFGSEFGVRAMLVLTALLGIAAVGQSLVVLIGGIDLSIPFLMGFGNVVAAELNGQGVPFGIVVLIVLGMAALIGAFNGALSARLKIHPLIVTLGVGTIVQGAVLLWTAGFPSGRAPQYITDMVSLGARTGPLPFPPIVPIWLGIILLISFVLDRTILGRTMYALGSSPEAARLALVRPLRVWAITFAISAVFAAIAGILLVGFTGSAYAYVGDPYLFQTIAAVVIGGTSLQGGRGSYVGTMVGAFVLIELNTVLIGLGFNQALIQAALGIIIITLVSIYGREPHVRRRI
ncbi:MAG: ABC transporter permease [Chloroflexi bacterium]|nr:ABC transporter permease [Chloroflexota bacterium]